MDSALPAVKRADGAGYLPRAPPSVLIVGGCGISALRALHTSFPSQHPLRPHPSSTGWGEGPDPFAPPFRSQDIEVIQLASNQVEEFRRARDAYNNAVGTNISAKDLATLKSRMEVARAKVKNAGGSTTGGILS